MEDEAPMNTASGVPTPATRTTLNITCPYCHADPRMPCEERERDPLDGRCLIQAEIDLDHRDAA